MSDLNFLYDVARIITAAPSPRAGLARSLQLLVGTGLDKGSLGIVCPATGELLDEVGDTGSKVRRGIVLRVADTGSPIIVSLNDENTGAAGEPTALLCVPVRQGTETIGVLGCDRLLDYGPGLEKDLQLLTVLSGLFAQSVVIIRSESGREEKRCFPLSATTGANVSFSGQVENFERELIVSALERARGNQTRAAGDLGLSLRIINYKIGKYKIDYRKFRKVG